MEDNTQDYDLIDDFIRRSLESFSKQVLGEYDEETGYFEEINPEEEEEEEVTNTEEIELSEISENTDNDESDEEMIYKYLMGDDPGPVTRTVQKSIAGTAQKLATLGYTGFKNGVSPLGPKAGGSRNNPGNIMHKGQYVNYATPEEGRAALANQLNKYQTGNTRTGLHGNKTLTEAMKVYASDAPGYAAFIAKKLGVSTSTPIKDIDPVKWAAAITTFEGNTNVGKHQAGGVAITPQQQYTGLNDDSIDQLMMPLEGTNTIRGLDSGLPVEVWDGSGNEEILYGPQDTAKMKGTVYEQRMQVGGEIGNPGWGTIPDETETTEYILRNAKDLKLDKKGNFKALLPLDLWEDRALEDTKKFKIVTRKGEKFIKWTGKIPKYEMRQPEIIDPSML